MLCERLFIYSCVRFAVVGAIVVGAPFARRVLGIVDLDESGLLMLAAWLGAYNLAIFAFSLRHRNACRRSASAPLLIFVMHATIVIDFAFLTVALWFVGGAQSPFQAFYILHVIIAGLLLSRRATFVHAVTGYAMLATLVLGQWTGAIPGCWPGGAVNSDQPLDGRYVLAVLVVQGVLIGFSAFLVSSLSHLLRAGEHELRRANTALEHLSQMQRDFLRIALHDLKSPLAAVTGLLHNLESEVSGSLTPDQERWIARAQDRLKDLLGFLRDLQTLAQLESGRIAEQVESVDTKALLEHVVDEYQDLARLHEHTLQLELQPGLPAVRGIPTLLREIIANLVSNAIKYTPNGGVILVRAMASGDRVRIEVEDNGVGIAPEDQGRLFNEFVRIRRRDAAVANVPGTGLGLSIARRIAELHGGRITVISELNKGTVFTVSLPLTGAIELSRM